MATNLDIYNHCYSVGGVLLPRFMGSCLKSAGAIKAESGATSNHANRVTWANSVIATQQGCEDRARQIMFAAFANNATLQQAGETATDNDIDYLVAAFIDTFATGA
jgi:hypothetical protein